MSKIRNAFIVALGLVCLSASAQQTPQYTRVEYNGALLTRRPIINFTGPLSPPSCADNASFERTDCTLSGGGGGGGSGTLAASYATGASATDQTLLINSGDGGPLICKANGAATGILFRVLTSISGVVADFSDNASLVLRSFMADGASAVALIVDTGSVWSNAAARIASFRNHGSEQAWILANGDLYAGGSFISNPPAYGSPVIGSQLPGGFMSYTADGVGPFWAGTGITMRQTGGSPSTSTLTFTLDDDPLLAMSPLTANSWVIGPRTDVSFNPAVDLGIMDGSIGHPFRRINGQIFGGLVGSTIASASTIAPDSAVHIVSGTTQINTITVPYTNFTGTITLLPSGLWTLGTSGNIGSAVTAVVGQALSLTYDGTKWRPSYLSGSGLTGLTSGRVDFSTGTNSIGDDGAFLWDNTAKRLSITTSGPAFNLGHNSASTFGADFRGGKANDVNFSIGNTDSSGFGGFRLADDANNQRGSFGHGNSLAALTYARNSNFFYSDLAFGDPWTWVTGTSRLMTLYAATSGNLNLGTGLTDQGVKLRIEAASTSAGIEVGDGSSLSVSASSTGRIRYNGSSQVFEWSRNAASYVPVGDVTTNTVQTITAAKTLTALLTGTQAAFQQFWGAGSTPTFTAGAASGTSPTIVVTGSDASFLVDITAGTSPPAGGGTLLTIHYANSYAIKPKGIQIQPCNATLNTLVAGGNGVYPDNDAGGTDAANVVIAFGPNGLNATQDYKFYVTIIR